MLLGRRSPRVLPAFSPLRLLCGPPFQPPRAASRHRRQMNTAVAFLLHWSCCVGPVALVLLPCNWQDERQLAKGSGPASEWLASARLANGPRPEACCQGVL